MELKYKIMNEIITQLSMTHIVIIIIIIVVVVIIIIIIISHQSGADPGFSLRGGGGTKRLCAHVHHERGTELAFGRGTRPALIRALEALGLF